MAFPHFLRQSLQFVGHPPGGQCQNNGHSAKRVHRYVSDALYQALRDPSGFIAARDSERDDAKLRDELATVETSISDNRDRLTRMLAGLEAGAVRLDEFVPRRAALDQAHANLQAARTALLRNLSQSDDLLGRMAPFTLLSTAWAKTTHNDKRQVALALIRYIVLERGHDPHIVWR